MLLCHHVAVNRTDAMKIAATYLQSLLNANR